MANIKVNPHKSCLLSNSQHTPSFSFMNSTIPTQAPNTPLKFLGCWYTASNKLTIISKIITQEIFGLSNIIETKQITDKQASYIINNVLTPIFEYRIHNIVIPHSVCNKILSNYLTIAKHKSKLPRSIPNSTMLNYNIYGNKNVWDIQLQHYTSNFMLRLNQYTNSFTTITKQSLVFYQYFTTS